MTTLFSLTARVFVQYPLPAATRASSDTAASCWRQLVDSGWLSPRTINAHDILFAFSSSITSGMLQSLDLSPPFYASHGSPPALRQAIPQKERGIVSLAAFRVVGAVTGLVRLSLSGCRTADNASLHELASLGASLAILDLTGCVRINDTGFKALPDLLPRLERLVCSGTSLTDSGAQHLARLDSLRELDLSTTQLTDRGVLFLCDGSSRDRLLSLGLASTYITSSSLDAIANLPSLRSIDLRGCSKLTSASFAAFKVQVEAITEVVSVKVVSPMKLEIIRKSAPPRIRELRSAADEELIWRVSHIHKLILSAVAISEASQTPTTPLNASRGSVLSPSFLGSPSSWRKRSITGTSPLKRRSSIISSPSKTPTTPKRKPSIIFISSPTVSSPTVAAAPKQQQQVVEDHHDEFDEFDFHASPLKSPPTRRPRFSMEDL